MIILAASALERAAELPKSFWVNILLALAALIVGVFLYRHAAQMNRLLLSFIVFIAVIVVGFQWVYERNEPRFLSSSIDRIAPYLPKKIDYASRQSRGP